MKRIVVGVDCSEGSLDALDWATGVAERTGAPLQLVTGWEYPWWSFLPAPISLTPVPNPGDVEGSVAAGIEALVAERGIEHLLAGRPVIREGGGAAVLVGEAQPDDLVVVGTRGHGAAVDTLIGSVSSRVVATAPCSVVVVPPGSLARRAAGPVVVGVDGSDQSLAAVAWAVANTGKDTPVTVVATWGVPMLFGHDGLSSDVATVLESDQRRAEAAADRAAGVLASAGRPFCVEVCQGDARRVIAEFGSRALMIVVGARGRTGLSHALLGSVTTSLVHRPGCVVVVVRS